MSVWMRQNEMLTNRLTCSTNRFQLMGKRQNEMCKAVVSFVTDGRALYVYSSSASIRLSFSLTHTRCLPICVCVCVSACVCVLCTLALYGSGERVYVCVREESFFAQRLICIVESLWLTDTHTFIVRRPQTRTHYTVHVVIFTHERSLYCTGGTRVPNSWYNMPLVTGVCRLRGMRVCIFL